MRKMHFFGALAGGLMAVCVTIAAEAADCGCGGMSRRSYNSLSGPPCFSPPDCSLAPGCCECPPSACDNAWAGYCEHKAKWQAFFARVGAPRNTYGCGNCGYGSPTPATRDYPADGTLAPKPATALETGKQPVPPVPVPEKTSRVKVLYPWMR
jgi:hypothetical protein